VDARFVRTPKWARPLWRQYGALTFRHTVFVRDDVPINDRLKAHELVHVAQYERYGTIGFVARYIVWNARYGYRENPLEREAYDA